MNRKNLQIGQVCTLPLRQEKNSKESDFYVVSLDDGDVLVRKYPFQRTEEQLPSELSCIVKELTDSGIVLRQNLIPIINKYYSAGEYYTFRVRSFFNSDSGTYYEVEDERGLYFRLYDKTKLQINQSVVCQVTKISGVQVRLRLAQRQGQSDSSIEFITLPEILSSIGLSDDESWYIQNIISHTPRLKESLKMLDDENPEWLLSLLKQFNASLCINFVVRHIDNPKRTDYVNFIISLYKKACLFLLEGSDFLRSCSAEERESLQNELSTYIENARHLERAMDLVRHNKHEEFIDAMLQKLKVSCFLYHPSKKFHILLAIFKLRPELINKKMGAIFDVILAWNSSDWESDPFYSAFIELLISFIEENRDNVDRLYDIANPDHAKSCHKMIEALAILFILADKNDGKQIASIKKAMFYRYLTLLSNVSNDLLLRKALELISGIKYKPEHKWEHIRQLPLLLTHCSIARVRECGTKSYTHNNVKISLSASNITISRADQNKSHSIFPNGFFDFANLQVELEDDIQVPIAKGNINLRKYNDTWLDIERTLFDNSRKRAIIDRNAYLSPGDIVKVKIDEVVKSEGAYYMHCVVIDAPKCQGRMNLKDIIRYEAIPSIEHFRYNGASLVYEVEVLGQNIEGEYSFRMLNIIADKIYEEASFGDHETCVIVKKHSEKLYSGLSEYGWTLWLNDDNADQYEVGQMVETEITEVRSGDSIYADITGPSTRKQFVREEVFSKMMFAVSEEETVTEELVDEVLQVEDILSSAEVSEMAQILRRKSVIERDYTKAFNLAAYARLLALTARDSALAAECKTQMTLYLLLHEFAKNSKIDTKELDSVSADVNNHPILTMLYSKLEIANSIDKPELNDSLWGKISSFRNDTLQRLAKLVVSYNLLSSFDLSDQQAKIKSEIHSLLNVNIENSSMSKYVGEESQYLEFKTSAVFPPENYMRPDLRKQLEEIVRKVCGFMNSNGGKLMIGVNDSGYIVGIDNDLKYFNSNRDRYSRSIRDAIAGNLGNYANGLIQADFDGDDTFVIEVKPSREIVRFNNVVYSRQGSSVRAIEEEMLDAFIADRKKFFASQDAYLNVSNDNSDEHEADMPTPQPDLTDTKEEKSFIKVRTSRKYLTGRFRNNVLHDYEEDFQDVIGYIYFRNDNQYMYSSTDFYSEEEDNLVLCIHESEKNSYLVIAYQSGRVVKTPIKEITDKDGGIYNLSTTEKIFFADIASDSDALLSVLTDEKDNGHYRLDMVKDTTKDRINSNGQQLVECSFVDIIAAEIIPSRHLSNEAMEKGLKAHSKNLGPILSTRISTIDLNEKVNTLLSQLK